MVTRHTVTDRIGFYLILAALVALSFWLVRSYLDIIAFSLITVILVKPLFDRIQGWVGGRAGLAVLLTLAALAVIVALPLWLALSVLTNQLGQFIADLRRPGGDAAVMGSISAALARRFGPGAQISPELQQRLGRIALASGSWLAGVVVSLGLTIPLLIARLFIFVGMLATLLPNYESFVRRLKRLSPLDDRIDDLFLQKIKVTVWAMFLAIFVIAVVQGLVMGLFVWLAGVPYAALWTLLAVVAAMLPLGASLIALPIGAVELLVGNYTAAVIVLGGYLLVVSNLDTFIRPRLVPEGVYLNFVLVLLSALGGYQLFGFFGVVYGPVLMVLLLTALDVYLQDYAEPSARATPAPPDTAGGDAWLLASLTGQAGAPGTPLPETPPAGSERAPAVEPAGAA